MDFIEAAMVAFENKDFVREFDRLYGTSLANRSGIELLVDRATGKRDEELMKFAAFFDEFVWSRLPDQLFVQ